MPSSQFDISYQNEELNLDDESYINKNSLKNSIKMKIGDLNLNNKNNINNISNMNNINNNNANENEKIMSNNIPTRTTEILMSESDLTDLPRKRNKKYFSLEARQDNQKRNIIINKIKKKDINKETNKINNITNKKIKNEQINFNLKKRKEEEKNISFISEKDKEKMEQNITMQSKKNDIYNNSNIICTTTDVKNISFENNNNILNTLSNISKNNNEINNVYEKYIIFKNEIKNKVNDFDLRISTIENDVNNLKDVINEILNSLNQINNKNKDKKEYSDNYYNCILTECKKYIDQKMSINLETIASNNNNYYYNTLPFYNTNNNNNFSFNQISNNRNDGDPNLNINSELYYMNNNSNISNAYSNNNNMNMKTSDDKKNAMNLSKIFVKKNNTSQVKKQFTKNKSHKNLFISLNKKKCFDQINHMFTNKINNKTNIKKEKYKKIKKEEQNEIEKILNNKLNKKLISFNEEIEDKIYKSLLQPTLRKLEKNLQNNFDSIKEQLRSRSVNYSHNITNVKSTRAMESTNNYSTYFNEMKNNINYKDTNDKTKRLFQMTNDYNSNNNNNFSDKINYGKKIDFEAINDNNIETEKIKRNIIKKQHQLNDLLYQLNNKQNESLNYFISFRNDNKSFEKTPKY